MNDIHIFFCLLGYHEFYKHKIATDTTNNIVAIKFMCKHCYKEYSIIQRISDEY